MQPHWQRGHGEVEISDVVKGDQLIWPQQRNFLEVISKEVEWISMDLTCGGSISVIVTGHELLLEGPEGGVSLLRRKRKGEGYVQMDSDDKQYRSSTEHIYRRDPRANPKPTSMESW